MGFSVTDQGPNFEPENDSMVEPQDRNIPNIDLMKHTESYNPDLIETKRKNSLSDLVKDEQKIINKK